MVKVSSQDRRLVVFAQRALVCLEIEAWNQQGERFFGTRIGLAEPIANGGRLVVAPEGGGSGLRWVEGRARDERNLAHADAAEARAGGGGLATLARRCQTVWLLEREGARDALALRLAAVIASVALGPILDPVVPEIFGVKTARAKLDALARSVPQTTKS